MPELGQDRAPKADVVQSILDAVTELMAGEVGESMFFDEPCFASDDRRQAIELASLVCRSPEAVDRFLSFCERQSVRLAWRARDCTDVAADHSEDAQDDVRSRFRRRNQDRAGL